VTESRAGAPGLATSDHAVDGQRSAPVVVVGAGIVGAAVAYEAARAGAEVVLVDKARPASGVTGDSFAWIGGPRLADVPDASTPLRRRVLAAYRRLEQDVPGVHVHWRGSLLWTETELDEDRPLGPDERLVDAPTVARLEPHLRRAPARAVRLDSDGAIDPVAVTRALVRAAQEHGARLLVSTAVTGLRVRDDTVLGVDTSSGFLPAGTVVVTAGADAASLCAPLGLELPVTRSPALLLRFAAPPGLVRTLVHGPDLEEVREAREGELWVAAACAGDGTTDDLDRTAREVRDRLVAAFDRADDVRLLSVRLAARPMPVDGLPIIGPMPGVHGAYVAVMHSAVTLAPAVARLVADDVVHGIDAEELAGLRPDRFLAPPLTAAERDAPRPACRARAAPGA
jgi:glycine/D-amino acid oxidase-like deaminating enzyme